MKTRYKEMSFEDPGLEVWLISRKGWCDNSISDDQRTGAAAQWWKIFGAFLSRRKRQMRGNMIEVYKIIQWIKWTRKSCFLLLKILQTADTQWKLNSGRIKADKRRMFLFCFSFYTIKTLEFTTTSCGVCYQLDWLQERVGLIHENHRANQFV